MPFVSKKFVDALQFYACAESYKRRGVHPKGSPVRYEASPIVRDHGGRARAALEELHRRRIFTRIRRLFRRERKDWGPRVITVPGPLFSADSFRLSSPDAEHAPPFTVRTDGQVVVTGCLDTVANSVAAATEPTDTHEA
ncbi:hypothetical protein ABZR86_02380 [Dyella marensis]|uniref:Uncharacterized protein n=1 Tax=Dyella marensis TaxID=500610 RepID=A0A1I2A292_9GAMM|nr:MULTISPECIES: hypothetical protein [Dyella]SFE37907.1 hypothetical protein SAMN02799615_00895 [Dyella marensis]